MRGHRAWMAAACLVAAAALVVVWALESAEVIVLHTRDAAGAPRATRIWVADDEAGTPWIEAANADRSWYHDLKASPEVEVERRGARMRFRAVPVPGRDGHATVRRLLAQKYGPRDTVVGWLADTSGSIGIRLEPPRSAFDLAKSAGVVSVTGGAAPGEGDAAGAPQALLAVRDAGLPQGTAIAVVLTDAPQRVARGRVGVPLGPEALEALPEAERGLRDLGTIYPLQLEGALAAPALGIGLVGYAGALDTQAGHVSADLDGDGRAETFDACTSREGVHLRIRSGDAASPAVLWEAYDYLGYDVEPTCPGAGAAGSTEQAQR